MTCFKVCNLKVFSSLEKIKSTGTCLDVEQTVCVCSLEQVKIVKDDLETGTKSNT